MERGGDARSALPSDPSLKLTRADATKARPRLVGDAPVKVLFGWCAAETPPRFHGEAEGHRIGLVVLCPLAALVGLVVGGTVMVVPPVPVKVVLMEMVASPPW